MNLIAARKAWKRARVAYQQTEAYRFGNPIIDDLEGKVNAWPLDEGLIDYVAASYGDSSDENPCYTSNVIANKKLVLSGRTIDTSQIDKALLAEELHEVDEIEANVAISYHAIEFLLWGQDLNGTGPGAGQRPASDFDPNKCTGGNYDRRATYLRTVTELLIDELEWITAQWGPDGAARSTLHQVDPRQGIAYDQLIGEGNKEGNAKVMAAIEALVVQTKWIERAVASLELDKITFGGSDSLDAPAKIVQ